MYMFIYTLIFSTQIHILILIFSNELFVKFSLIYQLTSNLFNYYELTT